MVKAAGCYHAVCSIGLTLFTLLFLVACWRFQVMFTEFKRVRRAHFLAHGAHGAQSMSLALALGTAETEADAEARRGPNTIKVLGRLAFHGLVLLCALLQIPYYGVCVRAYYAEQYTCHAYPWTNCYTTRIVSQAMQFMAFTVVANEWLQTVLAWERKHQPPPPPFGGGMANGGGGATGASSSALGSPGGKAGSARWDATSDLELSGGPTSNPLAGPGNSSSDSRLGLLSNTIGAVTDTALEVGDSVTRAATEAAKNATVLIGRYQRRCCSRAVLSRLLLTRTNSSTRSTLTSLLVTNQVPGAAQPGGGGGPRHRGLQQRPGEQLQGLLRGHRVPLRHGAPRAGADGSRALVPRGGRAPSPHHLARRDRGVRRRR
jgi:hypothetical protein